MICTNPKKAKNPWGLYLQSLSPHILETVTIGCLLGGAGLGGPKPQRMLNGAALGAISGIALGEGLTRAVDSLVHFLFS